MRLSRLGPIEGGADDRQQLEVAIVFDHLKKG